MKRLSIFFFLTVVSIGFIYGQTRSLREYLTLPEIYINTKCSQSELKNLSERFSVDNVSKDDSGMFNVKICLSGESIVEFEELGLPYSIVERSRAWVKMANTYQELSAAWNSYPTYQAYLETMGKFWNEYPELCRIDTILNSTPGNHSILCAHISSNVLDVGKPSIFLSSTIHGDEVVGYYLLIRLIDKLLSEYSSNSQIKELVDNIDIWICPLHNPDGTYRTSDNTINESPVSTRTNASGSDLNREFPQVGGVVAQRSSEPEVASMISFLEAHNFTIAANIHGGAEVFNYPWDNWMSWQRQHADHEWWNYVGRCYADTCHTFYDGYMTDVDNGVTPGGDWYIVSGSMQDYHNYFLGTRHATIEVSSDKVVSSYMLPYYWEYSNRSLLNFMMEAGNGIHGTVTDSLTGTPLRATVFIENHDIDHSYVETSLPHGDYHRPIKAGNYQVTYSSQGYLPKTVEVDVLDGLSETVDVKLVKNTGIIINNSGFSAYPNPAVNIFHISFDDRSETIAELKIYDSAGRLIMEKKSNGSFDLQISSIPIGVYNVVINKDGKIYRTKLVKI